MAGFFSSHRERERVNRPPSRPNRPEYLDEPDLRRPELQQPAPQRGRRDDQDNRRNDCDDDGRKRKPRMPGSQAILKAQEYFEALTGKVPEAISGLAPGKEGWKVTFDVVELERIPQTTDVLASYEMELDENGDLVNYRRVGRYYRNQVDEM